MLKNKYTVIEQYNLFLERIGLIEEQMHPMQRKQLKETFYAAVVQTLILLKDEISLFPEDVAVPMLESMEEEARTFFLNKSDPNVN